MTPMLKVKKNETDIPMKTVCHHPDKILLSENKPHCLHMALRAKRKVRREQYEDCKVLRSSLTLRLLLGSPAKRNELYVT